MVENKTEQKKNSQWTQIFLCLLIQRCCSHSFSVCAQVAKYLMNTGLIKSYSDSQYASCLMTWHISWYFFYLICLPVHLTWSPVSECMQHGSERWCSGPLFSGSVLWMLRWLYSGWETEDFSKLLWSFWTLWCIPSSTVLLCLCINLSVIPFIE